MGNYQAGPDLPAPPPLPEPPAPPRRQALPNTRRVPVRGVFQRELAQRIAADWPELFPKELTAIVAEYAQPRVMQWSRSSWSGVEGAHDERVRCSGDGPRWWFSTEPLVPMPYRFALRIKCPNTVHMALSSKSPDWYAAQSMGPPGVRFDEKTHGAACAVLNASVLVAVGGLNDAQGHEGLVDCLLEPHPTLDNGCRLRVWINGSRHEDIVTVRARGQRLWVAVMMRMAGCVAEFIDPDQI
jgi:hypothetical protein